MANTTWNPADIALVTLSNGNLTGVCTGQGSVRTVAGQTAGKYYFEITFGATGTRANNVMGIANASAILTTAPSNGIAAAVVNGAGSIAINGSTRTGVPAFSANGVCCVAFDVTASMIWIRNGAAGQWNGSGTANPATAAGGYSLSTLAGGATQLYGYAGGTNVAAASWTANFGDSAFSGVVPTGFTAGFPTTAPGVTGVISATDTQDTASFAGSILPLDSGILHATEAQDMATMTGNVTAPLVLPPGVPNVPQGDVVAMNYTVTQDYPRLVYTAPRFEVVAIADIIEPSVLEAVEGMLPSLVPPYVTAAANAAVQALAVQLVGSTMTGPLMLSPAIPTAPTMAATKQYVDTMVATVVPEVPPVPAGQAWARETGQWIPLAGGGTVTNIATGAGLTGGPITATGTISMANMAANSLKGNNTGAVAAPTDIPAGNVLTMIGAAPLNSPVFTGSPSLPTGTAAITQTGGTANTTVATTQFVANSLGSYAPIASPVFTGAPSLPAGAFGVTAAPGDADTSLATTAFVAAAVTAGTANYLPLTGGRLSGGLASGPAATTVPGLGALTLNANTVAPPAGIGGNVYAVGADGVNAGLALDSFGTAPSCVISARHARGTAAAPSTVQNSDLLLWMTTRGYGATTYGGVNASIAFNAAQTWTDAAQGSTLAFNTVPLNTTTPVTSLSLQGNTATFSGNVLAPTGFFQTQGSAAGYYLYDRVTGTNSWLISGSNAALNFVANTPTFATLATITWLGNLGQLHLTGGYGTQPGSGAASSGHVFNIDYPGPNFWVDSSNLGTIQITPSDANLKTEFAPVEVDTLAVVNKIALQQFDWLPQEIGDKTYQKPHWSCGYTAQDIRGLIPEAVMESADEQLSVDLMPLVAYLIGAVQQLSAKMAALEGRA